MNPHSALPPIARVSNLRLALLLAAIVLLAAWLRWPGTFYPVTLHYDEGAIVRSVLCRFPPSGTDAHPYLNRYLLSLPEGLACIATRLQGSANPVTETRASFAFDPEPFLHLGRSVSLLCGLAAIVAVFVLGNALGGSAVGLGAALLLAVAPAHVMVSNNLGQWSLAALMAALTLVFMNRYGKASASPRQLAVLGAITGLAVASVYTLGVLALPVLLVLGARWRENRPLARPMRDLAIVAAGALVGHVLGNFTAVSHFKRLPSQILQPTASLLGEAGVSVGYLGNVGWYFSALFDHQGLGLVVALLGLTGVALVVRKSGPLGWALLAFVAAIFLIQPLAVILMSNRYIVPAFPALVVAAAWLLVEAGRRVGQRSPGLARFRPGALLIFLAAIPGLLTDLDYRQVLALPSSRALAVEWIEAHIPSHAKLLQSIEFISPVIADCRQLALAHRKSDNRPCYEVTFSPLGTPQVLLDDAARGDNEYLVYTQPASKGTMERLGTSDERGRMLRERYPLLVRFHHSGLERFHDDTATVNPSIEIYKLRN